MESLDELFAILLGNVRLAVSLIEDAVNVPAELYEFILVHVAQVVSPLGPSQDDHAQIGIRTAAAKVVRGLGGDVIVKGSVARPRAPAGAA